MSVADALARRTQPLEVLTELLQSDPDLFGAEPFDVDQPGPAASTAWMFLPSFMPFSGLDGYVYFVDTRPGPQHGCVTEYAHSDTDSHGPKWDSVTTMLAAHADALESGIPVGNFRPAAVDGALSWEINSAR